MTGVGILVRSHLRRDRWMILWWCLGGTLLYWSQAVSVAGLYATQEELDRAAASSESNAAFIAMLGPARALDTVGGQIFWQCAATGAIVAGLMSMFLVGRHTRAEEESGRDELVRSAAIGRRAPLVAALVVALLANLALGVAVALSLLTVRDDVPLAGLPLATPDVLGTGLGLTLCGWVFSGTALAAAQLTQSTRTMYGIAGAVLGLAYGLRAIGDVGNGVLSWLSPIGWYQEMQPFAGLRWWPVLLMAGAVVLNLVAAYVLFGRRDVGSGILAARPGPATAGAGLRSGVGLAWRLHRGSVLGWTAGLLLVGLAYGSIGNSVEDLIGDSDFATDAMSAGMADDLVDGFYGTAIALLALIVSGFAISSALRPRAEEDSGHAEALLATGLSRQRWLGGHVLVSVAGTVVLLAAGGIGLGAGYALATGDADAFHRYGLPGLSYLAPVLVLGAVARLFHGCAPRLLVLAWVPLVFSVVVLMFGEALQLPTWVRRLSPFEHVALVPAESFDPVAVAVVGLVAVTLSVAGQASFRKRDVG